MKHPSAVDQSETQETNIFKMERRGWNNKPSLFPYHIHIGTYPPLRGVEHFLDDFFACDFEVHQPATKWRAIFARIITLWYDITIECSVIWQDKTLLVPWELYMLLVGTWCISVGDLSVEWPWIDSILMFHTLERSHASWWTGRLCLVWSSACGPCPPTSLLV